MSLDKGDHAGGSQLPSTVRNLLMASAPGFVSDDKTNEEVIVEDASELMVGQYVIWYMVDVYIAVDKEEEMYTLLKYMEKKGDNHFIWDKLNLLKISLEVEC